ncbi:MAG: HAMP domain-containing histidine kinase [Clostridiales bacterium]|nr:HAMP domain-containing histidine kinase [Clostridiales bacterium]
MYSKKIKEPLNKLYNGVHKISEGNLDYRIEYKGKDEFKQICDDFNEMAEHLKASVDRSRKEYDSRKEIIAGISHDLRTPLTSIKAYIEGLLEGVASTPEMQKKYMETILVKADDIDKMVDKLFLFSKLDLGDYPFYPEEINVKYEIEKFINQNKREYDLRGMNIEAEDIPEELRVYTDPVQLGNALTNIVENSLKYKNGERVNVKIYCKDGEKYTDIIIDDDGPGVAEEETGKLFDVFYRGDPSRSNPNKGSGLGLAITAKISEGQGGFVRAENIKPKGLRIIMTIPKERII